MMRLVNIVCTALDTCRLPVSTTKGGNGLPIVQLSVIQRLSHDCSFNSRAERLESLQVLDCGNTTGGNHGKGRECQDFPQGSNVRSAQHTISRNVGINDGAEIEPRQLLE